MKTAAFLACLATWVLVNLDAGAQPKHSFSIGDHDFLLDGKPFQIIGGEMHYSRIPREYWTHRLRMARAMGLNVISTYVFWNYHELTPGNFDFSTGNRDLAAFIRLAAAEGFWVVLRVGPYVCAEWDFGGYPWWLLRDTTMTVRSMHPGFLHACERYLRRLGQEVAELQITRGGPIIMVQVENEYGSFGKDKQFMAATRDMIRGAGFDVPLFTADGPSQCRNGSLPGILPCINGEDHVRSLRDTVNLFHDGKGPYYVPEYYPGWLDHWGEAHSIVPAKEFAGKFDTLLASGASVCFYMVHGGTNFVFWSGANATSQQPVQPQPTSYDYDAPIDEAGHATEKFEILRKIIQRHTSTVISSPPPPPPSILLPTITLDQWADFTSLCGHPIQTVQPISMEEAGQGFGYAQYSTTLAGPAKGLLTSAGIRDYAVVLVNGKRQGILDRMHRQDSLMVSLDKQKNELTLLVENLGRINYGKQLNENRKGLTGSVVFNGKTVTDWAFAPLLPDQLPHTRFGKSAPPLNTPVLLRGEFSLPDTGDCYLDMQEWGKGSVWVNGRHLGRYWRIGPQQTLFLPGVWLRKGKNDIIVLELLDPPHTQLHGSATAILNTLRTN
jgi:beta-galactosidase